jgi:uncharacterized repeat protein (TIGR03803 family)
MKTRFRLFIPTLALGLVPIAPAGCGTASSPALPNTVGVGAFREPAGGRYRTIYEFKNAHRNGFGPSGQLVAVGSVLYGTTAFGGPGALGNGTIFALTTSGEEHVLHKFDGTSDGHNPNGGLVVVNGMLYGTTSGGAGGCLRESGCGAVFAVTTSGKERWVYHFKGGTDGITPSGGLVWLDGKLYGTTSSGGDTGACPNGSGWASGCGTVFSIDTAGNERVLYRFRGGRDGIGPNAPLVALNGKLYGTTSAGGDYKNCYYGCGTIFEITTSGAETELYRFRNGRDGAVPNGGLLALDGVLYGTTGGGGGRRCSGSQCGHGTVFKATPSGRESVIYAFKGAPDAAAPNGDLVSDHGLLYGTSSQSGGEECFYWDSGTIFAVSTTGAERVVYTFSCNSIFSPAPGLFPFGHVLYGSADEGSQDGYGTVFAFTP